MTCTRASAVGDPAEPLFTSRPAGRWPGRPLLTSRLREVLRREFHASDAWVVRAGTRCRLEVLFGWRVLVLLEGHEDTFWAPFYSAAIRHRDAGGRRVAEYAPTQRPRRELLAVLEPLWRRAAEGNAAAGAARGTSPVSERTGV